MSLFANKQNAKPTQMQQAPLQPQAAPQPVDLTAQRLQQAAQTKQRARPSYDEDEGVKPVSEDVYEGIEDQTSLGRVYIDEVGTYRLKVIKLSDGIKPKGTNSAGRPFFGADFEIVASTNPKFPAGSQASWMSTQNDYPQYHLRAINNLLSSILHVAPEQINKSTVKDAASTNNPAEGMLVDLDVTLDPKGGASEDGKPYTRKVFKKFVDDMQESA